MHGLEHPRCYQQSIVGSPATVTDKIEKIWHEVGGFGVLLVFGFDYKHKAEALAQFAAAAEARGAAAVEASRCGPG